jgi:hypothetical protein
VQFGTGNLRGKGVEYLAFFLGAAMMKTRLDRVEDGARPIGTVQSKFRV